MPELAAGAGIALTTDSAQDLVRISVDAAMLAGSGTPYFPTTAAGISGTSNGDFFFVGTSGGNTLALYRNVSGVATAQDLDLLTVNGIENLVGPYVDQAEAARDAAVGIIESLQDIVTIGRQGNLTTGTSLTGNTRILTQVVPVTGVAQVRFWGLNTSNTIKISRFSKSGTPGVVSVGDVFTPVGSIHTVNVTGAGADSAQLDMAVLAGEFIGFHHTLNAIARTDDVTSATPFATGGSGDFTGSGFTTTAITSNIRLEIAFDVSYQVVTKERLNTMDADRAAHGFGVVVHEDDPAVERPAGWARINWVGEVWPQNAAFYDVVDIVHRPRPLPFFGGWLDWHLAYWAGAIDPDD